MAATRVSAKLLAALRKSSKISIINSNSYFFNVVRLCTTAPNPKSYENLDDIDSHTNKQNDRRQRLRNLLDGIDTGGYDEEGGFDRGSFSSFPESRVPRSNQGGFHRNTDFRRSFDGIDDRLSSTSFPQKTSIEGLVKNVYKEGSITAERSDEEVQEFLDKNDINLEGQNIPKPILSVEETNFSDGLKNLLKRNGVEKPFPIQSLTWPIVMSGMDTIGIAQTGSGKTLAFMLPAFLHILKNPKRKAGDGPRVLVVVPTRELCMQVADVAKDYGSVAKIRTALAYGGSNRRGQMRGLRENPDIVVCTPGRIIDFLECGTTNLNRCSYLVFDEADRMLDMGFERDIRTIENFIKPQNRQTLMWSATWPREIQHLARNFLSNPVHITIGNRDLSANPAIQQNVFCIEEGEKLRMLKKILEDISRDENGSKTLIFVNKKRTADFLSHTLIKDRIPALCMHGDFDQFHRNEVFTIFRQRKKVLLVATDVVARGIDVPDIAHVINYDFPLDMDNYVHRIGRTARAGGIGKAYTFFSRENHRMARGLIDVLEKAGQKVHPDLKSIGGTSLQFSRTSRRSKGSHFHNISEEWMD